MKGEGEVLFKIDKRLLHNGFNQLLGQMFIPQPLVERLRIWADSVQAPGSVRFGEILHREGGIRIADLHTVKDVIDRREGDTEIVVNDFIRGFMEIYCGHTPKPHQPSGM